MKGGGVAIMGSESSLLLKGGNNVENNRLGMGIMQNIATHCLSNPRADRHIKRDNSAVNVVAYYKY